MKRSNRLVLLIGIFLAIVAFVGIVLILQAPATQPTPTAPTELETVYAKQDISLGTQITADMIEVRKTKVADREADAFGDPGQVIGKTIRAQAFTNQQMTAKLFASVSGQQVTPLLEKGLRAIAVRVDQTTGVGTLINVGDRVDMVITTTINLLNVDQTTGEVAKSDVIEPSTKLILQNMQVVGTILPPPPAQTQQQQGQAPAEQGATLSGQTMPCSSWFASMIAASSRSSPMP